MLKQHKLWSLLSVSHLRRCRLWLHTPHEMSCSYPAADEHVYRSPDRKRKSQKVKTTLIQHGSNMSLNLLTTSHCKRSIWSSKDAMCICVTAQTCHKCIISQSLTRWDPRRKVRSDLHIGSSTRLQLKFKTEADARLMQRPSWRNTYTWFEQVFLHFLMSRTLKMTRKMPFLKYKGSHIF